MQTHGQINYHPNPSPNLGGDHRNNTIKNHCLVYTPPGYDEAKGGSYPVLYLLHGVGDVEFSWEVHGQVSAILDDLLRDGLILPMIVVMPLGFESKDQKFRRQFPTKEWFDNYLRKLVDLIEPAYGISVGKTADGRHVKRAIAGLSMGGKQALEFGLEHLDLFSAIGNFSGAIQMRSGLDPFPDLLGACDAKQDQLKKLAVLYHGCGNKDPVGGDLGPDHSLLGTNKRLVKKLRELGVPHSWHEMEGDHSWGVWKACLREFLPMVASAWRDPDKVA
jgi:enterochelin esterase-like enzyme